jgi:hypothetical protein
MVEFFAQERKFFVHPAHRAAGVLGAASVLSSSRPEDSWSSDSDSWKSDPNADHATRPLLLVADAQDYLSQASAALFERILSGRGQVRCHRVPFVSSGLERLLKADCVVIFNRGVHLVCHLPESDMALLQSPTMDIVASPGFTSTDAFLTVNVSSGCSHPIVQGFLGFAARDTEISPRPAYLSHTAQPACISTILLDGISTSDSKHSGILPPEKIPLAWAYSGRGRGFSTLLGRPDDFRNAAFVQLMLNAVDWVCETR